jgi:hypothetical protein
LSVDTNIAIAVAAPPAVESGRLPRNLGLLNAISINMSTMVGTGPFITVPAILATLGGPQSLIAWGVGAALAIADGLVFAELGSSIPASGGSYNFCSAAPLRSPPALSEWPSTPASCGRNSSPIAGE